MPLQLFPPEQENTSRVIAGQRSYRLTTQERVMVVNSKTFGVDGDNRFEPLARVILVSQFTSANAQSGGVSPDCSPYWANDVIARYTVVIASVTPQKSAVMPMFSEFQIRSAFGGIPTVQSTLSVGAAKPLAAGDIQGLLICDSGIGMNEIEIWGRIPTESANPAQTNAVPFRIVFGVTIETWCPTPNEQILGKFVTAIP